MSTCGDDGCEICHPPEPLERRMPAANDYVSPPMGWLVDHSLKAFEEAFDRCERESAEYRAGAHRRGRWVFLRNDSQYRQEPL